MLQLLVNPIFIFWLIVGLGGVSHYLKKQRLSRVLVYMGITWLFLVSVSPLPVWLTRNMEQHYPVLAVENVASAPGTLIVVLGGGYSFQPDLPFTDQLSSTALSRLAEAVRIYGSLPGSKLVCSGSTASDNEPQALMTAGAALELGVPPADTLMIGSAHDTAEEALDYVKRFGKQHPVILVTSAVHMKRAMKYFQAQGVSPVPAPADHLVKVDPEQSPFHFKPSVSKVRMMEACLHEYAGLLKFQLMGPKRDTSGPK